MKNLLFGLLLLSATAALAAPEASLQALDVAKIRESALAARKTAASLRLRAEGAADKKDAQALVKKAKGLEALAEANELLANVEKLRTETDGVFAKLAAATKETKALFESLK